MPTLPDSNQKHSYAPQAFHQPSTPQTNTELLTAIQNHPARDIDLNGFLFDEYRSAASSRSPSLTHSALSDYSPFQNLLDSFDRYPTSASPRGTSSLFYDSSQRAPSTLDDTSGLFANTDSMQGDWFPSSNAHLTPRSVGRPHQRESSLSSLGSNGPASPHPSNTINPFIASTDSGVDGLHGMHNPDEYNNHFQLAKSYNPSGQPDMYFPLLAPADNGTMSSYPRSAAPPRRKVNRGMQPLIGSGAMSGASSINSESPATPAEVPEDSRRRQKGEDSNQLEISPSSPSLPMFRDTVTPKLERTVSDIMTQELCSPNFTITSSNTLRAPVSPNNSVFDRRLQQAYNTHLAASPVGTTSRAPSPFRTGSPLAQMPAHSFSNYGQTQDARAQQQMRSANTSTPQTISPKDAMLEYHNVGDSANYPLFPPTNSNGFDMDAMNKAVNQSMTDNMAFEPYLPLTSGLQIPQQYTTFHGLPQSNLPSLSNSLAPTRLGSVETGMDLSPSNSPQRPTSTSAGGGTYSCTYHGCTRRFDTPQLLQKHKKEGHRGGGTRRAESVGPGMTSPIMDSQSGPHRCERINPSTGNPCNRIFSRPYDLTRHEGTVHDPEKKKLLCEICIEEKSFSRADALVRHYRVCHPDHEIPAKYCKRKDPSH